MKKENKKQWRYWVIGDTKRGFKVVTKRPRHKFVREPFETREQAERSIAMEYLLNA